jgi:hypothetical protein
MLLSFDQFSLVIAAVAIVTAIFLTSEWNVAARNIHPPCISIQSRPEYIPGYPPRVRGFIETILEEGRSYRKKQYREDDREPVVDFLNTLFLIPTFCNLSYTCYAIIQQVIEMRKQRELTIVQLQARLERQDIRFQPIDSA